MPNIPKADRIITALDVNSESDVQRIVEALDDTINFYKVGFELFVSEGHKIILYLKNNHKKVFLDLKFNDIPNTVSKTAASLVRLGIDMFTLHASGGRAMMKMTVDAVNEEAERLAVTPPKILAVTVLTSLSTNDLNEIGFKLPVSGWEIDIGEQVTRLALLAKECGVSGVVASPHEVGKLRKAVGDDMLIVTPGIRPSFNRTDDQKRVMTPKEAISEGADYLVVGRPILNADDPKEAVKRIISEIQKDE